MWSKRDVTELTEATLAAWTHAVEVIVGLTGLPKQQVHAQLMAFVNRSWDLHQWTELMDKLGGDDA